LNEPGAVVFFFTEENMRRPRGLTNLTPHDIVLIVEEFDEELKEWSAWPWLLPASGQVARTELRTTWLRHLAVGEDGERIPLVTTSTGEVTGLPDPSDVGDWLIVSRQVAEARRDRGDLLIVDDTVRDEQGRIIGARRLASVADPDALAEHLARRDKAQKGQFGL